MNECFLINHVRSCILLYTSQVADEVRLPYLEYDFVIAYQGRLNLTVRKISATLQEIPVVECYVSKVVGINSPA